MKMMFTAQTTYVPIQSKTYSMKLNGAPTMNLAFTTDAKPKGCSSCGK